ncbi:hypothetical protein GOODEAATRI_008316 [Goodea atripinnis]|uniref:Uncharacterized protein n=1 Tax=Goodea atripinnis TaxID=208336 RepID=A0ABV0MG21_9TELE
MKRLGILHERTNDVIFERQEASPNQRHTALLAVEAVVVPLTIFKRDVLAAPETWDKNSRVESHDFPN